MENNNFEIWTYKYFKKVVANMKDEEYNNFEISYIKYFKK